MNERELNEVRELLEKVNIIEKDSNLTHEQALQIVLTLITTESIGDLKYEIDSLSNSIYELKARIK